MSINQPAAGGESRRARFFVPYNIKDLNFGQRSCPGRTSLPDLGFAQTELFSSIDMCFLTVSQNFNSILQEKQKRQKINNKIKIFQKKY